MKTKEMKSKIKDLEHDSKFFLEKFKDSRLEVKAGEDFAKQFSEMLML